MSVTWEARGTLGGDDLATSLCDVSARSRTSAEPSRIIVIGSGFGGLAAAIRLAARGHRVTVLEKLDAPGGRAYVFRQDGFTFDAGPTVITAPFLLEELWRLCGQKMSDHVDLRPISPFYRLRFDDGTFFNYGGSAAAMSAEVERLSPGDRDGYARFMRASEAIYRVGFEELGHKPFLHLSDMVRIIPKLVRLCGYRTVFGLVSSFVRDPKLQIALSFHPLLVGGNPFTTTAIYCLIAFLEQRFGVHFAMGGTGAIVSGLVRLAEGQGVRMRYGSEVAEIVVSNGRARGVRLTSGEVLGADTVVSNADAAWTYRHLLASGVRHRWSDARLDRTRYSMGLYVWYFGTRKQYPEVAHHSILLGPRYRGLLDDIFKHKRLSPDMSLYLHRPTATDPSLAPAGCDSFYVLAPVPNLEADVDWTAEAEPFRRRLEKRLAETVLPELGAHIVTSRVMTPLDFQNRLLSYRGAAFSLEPTLGQSAWFRPHNRSEDVENLYLVGAGTHPGAGLPGVLSSARALDELIEAAHHVH
ncbi:MAG: phytoene desaturase [Burkholderiaceae bacterium]